MTTGLPRPDTAWRSASACAVPEIASGGTKTTTNASTSSDRPAAPTAAARSSGLTVVPASTGSPATTRSSPFRASTTSRFSAVELLTTATRPPVGSGWVARSWAVSNICVTFCTRITPECSNSACTRVSSTGATGAASARPSGRRSTARSSPR